MSKSATVVVHCQKPQLLHDGLPLLVYPRRQCSIQQGFTIVIMTTTLILTRLTLQQNTQQFIASYSQH